MPTTPARSALFTWANVPIVDSVAHTTIEPLTDILDPPITGTAFSLNVAGEIVMAKGGLYSLSLNLRPPDNVNPNDNVFQAYLVLNDDAVGPLYNWTVGAPSNAALASGTGLTVRLAVGDRIGLSVFRQFLSWDGNGKHAQLHVSIVGPL